MSLNYTKVIADPVFGWIRLTDEEARFIDSCRYVQRLRYVKQLGFTYMVYPSARHSRFEHSLGAVQVVTLMFERLMRLSDIREQLLNLGKPLGLDSEGELLLHVRLAALLHDLGHLPFSHVFEGVFGQDIDPLVNNCSEGPHEVSLGWVFKGPFKEHELITYFILTNNAEFRETVKETLPNIDLRIIKAILHSDVIGRLMLTPQGMEVVGQEDRDFLGSLGESAKLLGVLKGLISGDLDADRVEYILRDSYLTGASIGSVIGVGDIERIIDNMRVVTNNGNYVLAFDEKARANLEGFMFTRFNIYKLVYLHHKVVLFNTLARNLMATLLRHYDELNEEMKDYLCRLYRFAIGLLSGYDVMYVVDDYLTSLLLRNRQYLVSKIRGISKYLDPFLTRNTVYKALWKRDIDFMDLINRHGVDLRLINDVFPYLLSKGEIRDRVFQAFYDRLRAKLHEARVTCLGALDDEELGSSIIVGFRIFEPEARLFIMHGSKLVSINELSPLAQSISNAWQRSPHIFAFVDTSKVRSICGDFDSALEELRGIVILAINEALRDLGNVISKYFKNS